MSNTNGNTTDDLADRLEQIAKELREKSKPLPPEFQKVIDDNYWWLLDIPKGRPMCDACRKGAVCGCYQPEWDSPR